MEPSKPTRKRGCLRLVAGAIGVVVLLCGLASAAVSISNRTLPPPPTELDRLTDLDRARLSEALRIKATFGEAVWPGWGEADIPIIIWNSENAFLVGMEEAPPGWSVLEGETFADRPIYWRGDAAELSAFTEQLAGDTWVGSMSTKWEVDNGFISAMRDEMIPAPVNAFVPYRILIMPTEVYMGGILHETFHAYQATVARERFDDAEAAYADGDRYWQADESTPGAWSAEIGLLIDAMGAESEDEARSLARQFLAARDQRRAETGLDEALIRYEQRFEWLEGLAKYVELGMYEAPARDESYQPLDAVTADPDFQHYDTYNQRWSSEMLTMRSQSSQGEGRFYYTGMAQARLLDRLLPGWEDRIFEDGVWLETLLGEAVGE